jgi:hypothetical protein
MKLITYIWIFWVLNVATDIGLVIHMGNALFLLPSLFLTSLLRRRYKWLRQMNEKIIPSTPDA